LGMGSGRLKYLVAAFQIKIRVIASQRLPLCEVRHNTFNIQKLPHFIKRLLCAVLNRFRILLRGDLCFK